MASLHERTTLIEAAIAAISQLITKQGVASMTALTDLNTAVAAIAADVVALGTSLASDAAAVAAAITALQAAVGTNDDVGVEAAVAQLNTAHAALQGDVTSLNASAASLVSATPVTPVVPPAA